MSSTAIIRSQVAAVVRKVAAEYAEEMLLIHVEIARDKKVFASDRIKAANGVLDRAAGKPTQETSDENFNPDTMAEKMRTAREQAREVMNPELPANVVLLRRQKIAAPKRKVERRRLAE